MDYFRKYLSGPGEGQAPSGTETIDRLCDRVQSSTLLEDRRDAVRALKSLSRKYRVEVGTRAMDILLNVLQTDRNDAEILGYTLDTFCNITINEKLEEELELHDDLPEDLGLQFTEVFIKTVDNVSLLLSLLEEYDFHVRWPTVKLITQLLGNKQKDIQEIILTNPMGVSKMMDLLSDSREIIRNDGLLLLIVLTKGNTNIQKIVAFENAFERLLDIITEEGSSDGGIVVEDCLLLLINLLKNNQSNQNFFKEGSYVQRLAPYFELQPQDENPQGGWSAQKVTNVHLMLQVVRTLVSPNNPQQQTASCQKVMYTCGLLEKLCYILMASGVPADVLSESIHTVSEVIRGNQANQEYFASVMAPSNPPRPAIVVLLMSMVNEKQPFSLRCAVLYCFQSFLHKNELGQSQIIQTLLPSTAEVNTISAGQLLCGGLFSSDPMSTWFAAVALLHAVINSKAQKEQLVRVQLATSLGNPPVSLLQQATNILAQGGKLQTRVAILMLMGIWMSDCHIAVEHFLHNSANVTFLISQVSASEGDEMELMVQGLCAFLLGICVLYNKDNVETNTKAKLRAVIEKRIGLELFTDKISQVAKSEFYSRAAKKPQMNYKHPSEVYFDYAFTQTFRKLEHEVLAAVSPVNESESSQQKLQSIQDHQTALAQFQDLIREQDSELNNLRNDISNINSQLDIARKKEETYQDQIQQLKDQNALLKASKGGSFSGVGSQGDLSQMSQVHHDMEIQKQSIEEKDKEIETLKEKLTIAEAQTLVNNVETNLEIANGEGDESALLQVKLNQLNSELENLRHKIEQKDEEVIMYKSKYEESLKAMAAKSDNGAEGNATDTNNTALLLVERNNLSLRVTELEKQLGGMQLESAKSAQETDSVNDKLTHLQIENSSLSLQLKDICAEKEGLDEEKWKLLEKVEAQSREHDDLLVLMSDQMSQIDTFKDKLRGHGEVFSDDEDNLSDGDADVSITDEEDED